ncbi:MAG TPA: hypothetical protein VLR89_05835, partial [Anaerolineaceae bacterium]|nr:hypothetical protein [Anaerolineaceae bacterium]
GRVDAEALIEVHGGDISARDNTELANAGNQAASVAGGLLDRNLIDANEYLRLVYRFMGESLPKELKE